VWFFGLVLFLPGVSVYLWDFFRLSSVEEPEAMAATAGE
jgi:hypothetical protein